MGTVVAIEEIAEVIWATVIVDLDWVEVAHRSLLDKQNFSPFVQFCFTISRVGLARVHQGNGNNPNFYLNFITAFGIWHFQRVPTRIQLQPTARLMGKFLSNGTFIGRSLPRSRSVLAPRIVHYSFMLLYDCAFILTSECAPPTLSTESFKAYTAARKQRKVLCVVWHTESKQITTSPSSLRFMQIANHTRPTHLLCETAPRIVCLCRKYLLLIAWYSPRMRV